MHHTSFLSYFFSYVIIKSNLSTKLYQAGFQNITNIDFSPIVIEEMKKKNTKYPKMKWEVMDMLHMKYVIFLSLKNHKRVVVV